MELNAARLMCSTLYLPLIYPLFTPRALGYGAAGLGVQPGIERGVPAGRRLQELHAAGVGPALTIVHVSARPEPFLTRNTSYTPPNTP
jgi:hypothetical protein